MPDSTSPALQTAVAYHHAWSSHDIDTAMTYIADDIVCLAPAGRLEGAEAFHGFRGPFVQMLTGSNLIATWTRPRSCTTPTQCPSRTLPVQSASR
jgi:ketosteroid isomerase-like protein